MSHGNLYRESIASTIHESPRETRAWLGWLFLGMIAGAALMGSVWEYDKSLERSERASHRTPAESQSGGHLSQPTAGAR